MDLHDAYVPKATRRVYRARFGRDTVDGAVVSWTQNANSYGVDTHRWWAVRRDGWWHIVGVDGPSRRGHTWWELCARWVRMGVTAVDRRPLSEPTAPIQIAPYPPRGPRPLYPAYGVETLGGAS